MYRYADPIAGRHEAHLRKATRSGVKPARAKEQVNEIAEATQQITKSGRSHLSYNDNNFSNFIKFFIHEVKQTSMLRVFERYICLTNINNRDFYVYPGISL